MRTVNKNLLRAWLSRNGAHAKEHLAVKAQCSSSLLTRLLTRSYDKAPRPATRFLLCQAMGLSEDEMFPLHPQHQMLPAGEEAPPT